MWMVGEEGFEPSTLSLRGICSNQLSYSPEISWHIYIQITPKINNILLQVKKLDKIIKIYILKTVYNIN